MHTHRLALLGGIAIAWLIVGCGSSDTSEPDTWQNPDTKTLHFPTEMCSGVAYFVSNDGHVQPCLDGLWL